MPSFAELPDPAQAGSSDELVERLRLLKAWAGDPSYEMIKDRVNAAWTAAGRPPSELARRSTVANVFAPGRRRFNPDLVIAVVEALHPEVGYVNQWAQALRVVGGEADPVAQVRVWDSLPPDLDAFTGRAEELDRLRTAMRAGDAVVISAIEGMAGVGKTQLAVHAGHRMVREEAVDRVLFVNLRGFHPDSAQPPADPGAVLDGFLRLLGVPGQQIPPGLEARAAAYRDRLAGSRTLVVLDNAATADQVRPLLPGVAGCPTLVTSRRNLAELEPATQLAVDAFTPDEALAFLTSTLAGLPVGTDPGAAGRIARRAGHLPLALSLIAGHILGTTGWTLTDHADRLDERHRARRLDSGVELALDLSYQGLPHDQQRLFRLAALHPGQDFDVYAAAALAGTGQAATQALLDRLGHDHLLQPAGPGRYTFHDLVRAYAVTRAQDQDPPPVRRKALTRLFDYYLVAAAAAMNALHPAETHRRPPVEPVDTPAPDLADPEAAAAWLETERPTLVAVAAHTAAHDWPGHTTRLARVLYRYLQGADNNDALAVHGHALDATRDSGDLAGQGHALIGIAIVHLRRGETGRGAGLMRDAVDLFRQVGDPLWEAVALHNLGMLADRSEDYKTAIDHWERALALVRTVGDQSAEAQTLNVLGIAMERAGRFVEAIGYCRDALTLARASGNEHGTAFVLNTLGTVELTSGRPEDAGEHLREALAIFQRVGSRAGEATVLDSLGLLHTRLEQPEQAVDYHEQALVIVREIGDQDGETHVRNGLGAATLAAARPADALVHFTAAQSLAEKLGVRGQLAEALAGLGRAHQALGATASAREHYSRARDLYAEFDTAAAAEMEKHLDSGSAPM
ncbi:tetratricopeptide repeat protein [Actinoplanes sp. TRM 88003]|uniref:Tetratricopeptide repeat protein n=1 Tax=Paractinoplanes aksuensis TaxID=2939490 RepID=A0ABT1DE28_9ACTN|nr:tetratricopeptide repeat protein [Actinoplanes aksuensis]MCO8269057.1 tetratricopeptide repeat protein [Actinoplanes aksuensis]